MVHKSKFVKLKNYYKALKIYGIVTELTPLQKNKIDPKQTFKINMNYIISLPQSDANKIEVTKK